MYKILLVEDDFQLASELKKQIESWGNQVKTIEDFRNVDSEFREYNPELVIMDLMLPFYNGFHWVEEIRKTSSCPVLFLSSASDDMNIVMAINMGADDFIKKPVDKMVLNAKIKASLRRAYEIGNDSLISFNGAILNVNDNTLEYEGKKVDLTKNEFRILNVLLENRGKIVSRDKLMIALWQNDIYVEENTLSVNVARLRKELEEIGLKDVIKTKQGLGYIIE